MSASIKAYAAKAQNAPLELVSYDPGPLPVDQVEITVESCGLCHSDLAMISNGWGISTYPLIAGHEVIGTITAVGEHVTARKVGQRVGLGWWASSCLSCYQCLSGNHNLCPFAQPTIIGHAGGFAEKVRCQWIWAAPLPETIDPASAGPMFCGGITVFNPLLQFGVSPTDRVGVIGIGGLGHLALKFFRSWGCEVIAFTSSDSKREEALKLGAHQVVNSTKPAEIEKLRGSLNFVISTASATLDWATFFPTLAPKGRIHFVGATGDPVPVSVPQFIGSQYSLSASPVGSPATMSTLLNFAGRHGIAPQTEYFPMSRVNDALKHLHDNKARYRIVLQADF
ncbi:NADPH-dependent aldehyde reductase Ahr [Planctomicrobium sp. SH661]|uniref:NADPH-dependent aldehyde reductase Ahr n=1 Tax=Planctomicrobium sp. SH661 TaxID=3448124 RepID=UPI003F5BCC77